MGGDYIAIYIPWGEGEADFQACVSNSWLDHKHVMTYNMGEEKDLANLCRQNVIRSVYIMGHGASKGKSQYYKYIFTKPNLSGDEVSYGTVVSELGEFGLFKVKDLKIKFFCCHSAEGESGGYSTDSFAGLGAKEILVKRKGACKVYGYRGALQQEYYNVPQTKKKLKATPHKISTYRLEKEKKYKMWVKNNYDESYLKEADIASKNRCQFILGKEGKDVVIV